MVDKLIKQALNNPGITHDDILSRFNYYSELYQLQVELVKLQQWVIDNNERVAIIFEGRDASGKGGAIRRFNQHIMPRYSRVVALPKPNDVQKGQWYFQRYIKELPNPGELVFFDRSWYNRAVVEPVMGFCTDVQYQQYMQQVPEFEHMLYEDGVRIVKFWFSVSRDEQNSRFEARRKNPLKQWKLSPVDKKAQQLWDSYTLYKEQMFAKTHTNYSPWIVVKANDKLSARLESIRYVLSIMPYEGKDEKGLNLFPDPNVISRYFRQNDHID
ncbi:MAG: polyphosphate kinase 2 [Bacteroidetes bacterium]|nr:polyphosphate kinase 2 [Bacteroidota bacterium]